MIDIVILMRILFKFPQTLNQSLTQQKQELEQTVIETKTEIDKYKRAVKAGKAELAWLEFLAED